MNEQILDLALKSGFSAIDDGNIFLTSESNLQAFAKELMQIQPCERLCMDFCNKYEESLAEIERQQAQFLAANAEIQLLSETIVAMEGRIDVLEGSAVEFENQQAEIERLKAELNKWHVFGRAMGKVGLGGLTLPLAQEDQTTPES